MQSFWLRIPSLPDLLVWRQYLEPGLQDWKPADPEGFEFAVVKLLLEELDQLQAEPALGHFGAAC